MLNAVKACGMVKTWSDNDGIARGLSEMNSQLNKKFKQFLLTFGWRFPLLRVISSRRPVILLYHGIPAEGDGTFVDGKVFERHICFLKQHFELVSSDNLGKTRKARDKIRAVLTFDDGLRNHAEVVAPILQRHNVPAVFFVCSRHATPGKYLWFSYLCALEKHFRGNGFYFRGEFIDMSPGQRQLNIQGLSKLLLNLTPHPTAMYQAIEEELPHLEDFLSREELVNRYGGMTSEQVHELAADPLFSIGVHTVDHPFLTQCEHEEAFHQMQDNKTWIEQVSNRRCNIIAYPSGDYNAKILKQCRRLGFTRGYAITPIVDADLQFELPRIGIYSTSLDILGFKVRWGNIMRALRIEVG
jgi:peptidoglycan/xylan/chitin deacetylase (PgdA/CDA1 family)